MLTSFLSTGEVPRGTLNTKTKRIITYHLSPTNENRHWWLRSRNCHRWFLSDTCSHGNKRLPLLLPWSKIPASSSPQFSLTAIIFICLGFFFPQEHFFTLLIFTVRLWRTPRWTCIQVCMYACTYAQVQTDKPNPGHNLFDKLDTHACFQPLVLAAIKEKHLSLHCPLNKINASVRTH